MMVAELRAPEPPAPVVTPPAPKPAAPPRRQTAPIAPASVQADVPAAAEVAPASPPVTDAAAPVEQAAAVPVMEAPVPVPPVPPAAPAAPSYKVSLPPSAELTLDVTRVDANGTTWSGLMAMSWKRSGQAYAMRVEASISMVFTRVNLLSLTSEGSIDSHGIVPRMATEKRRGKAQTATHFKEDEGLITFSAVESRFPLLPGVQDKATVPFQLAGIARADSSQLSGGVEIQVGEERSAPMFNFVVVGQEDIDTAIGKLATWHLSRPPRPGSYNSRLDIWLAPAHNWYPVQLRNTEANGAVTTQTISKIVLTDQDLQR